MLYNISYLFILFIFYSFLGFITELISCTLYSKKLVLNRGFLMGPCLPIYGVCCVLMNLCLEKYTNDILVLFVMSMMVCSITEFFTSYILEKIFKVRWWDYSHRKFNLDGRICIFNSIMFGLGGILLIHIINPFIVPILDKLPSAVLIIISIIFMIIFITDLVVSIITLCKIKISSNKCNNYDATEEIKKLVSETLRKNSFLFTRLLNAFPKITGKNKVTIVEIKKAANEFRKRLKENKEKLKTKKIHR